MLQLRARACLAIWLRVSGNCSQSSAVPGQSSSSQDRGPAVMPLIGCDLCKWASEQVCTVQCASVNSLQVCTAHSVQVSKFACVHSVQGKGSSCLCKGTPFTLSGNPAVCVMAGTGFKTVIFPKTKEPFPSLESNVFKRLRPENMWCSVNVNSEHRSCDRWTLDSEWTASMLFAQQGQGCSE